MASYTFAVAGAGIGGLATAIALRSIGHDVTIYEQAAAFGRVGAGINLTPNAVRVLDRLGAGAALRRTSSFPAFRVSRTWDTGAETSRLPMGNEAEATYGSPQLTLHRADLLAALEALVPPDAVAFGRRCTALAQDGTGVTLHFENGSTARADAVIGCDGIHSAVHAALFGASAPVFTQMSAYRAIVPVADVAGYECDAFVKWWGPEPKSQIVTMPLNGNRDLFLFATIPEDASTLESWSNRGDPAQLRAAYAGFHADAQRAIGAVTATQKTAMYVRDPLPAWTSGRVALLGDACHPMLPFMAQGAAMALEDAAILMRSVEAAGIGPGALPRALQRYEASRLPRAARIQTTSNANDWLRTGNDAAWVYGYDALTAPLADL